MGGRVPPLPPLFRRLCLLTATSFDPNCIAMRGKPYKIRSPFHNGQNLFPSGAHYRGVPLHIIEFCVILAMNERICCIEPPWALNGLKSHDRTIVVTMTLCFLFLHSHTNVGVPPHSITVVAVGKKSIFFLLC